MYIGNKLINPNQTPTTIETLGELLESEGYTLYYASSKNNIFLRFLDMVNACFKYSKQVNYVLIDTYSTLNFYYALGISILCRLLKKPYICILHGGNLENRLIKFPFLAKTIFKNAHKLIAPSGFLESIFKKYGYTEVLYVPNTIEIANYPYKKRENIQAKLLWVRSFSRIYNPKLAIDILCLLKENYKQASLCMVGPEKDGSMQETIAYAEEKNVAVHFTGKLSKKEWTQLASEYDVFINTTNVDNMPVSVVEAMALGLPIVSTHVGGLPFLVADKNEALLVPPNNPEAMMNAVQSLLESSELVVKITGNARQKAELFDWKHVKQQWFKILEDGA